MKRKIALISAAIISIFLAAYAPKKPQENNIVPGDIIHFSHLENMNTDDGTLFFGLNSGNNNIEYGFENLYSEPSDDSSKKSLAFWPIWNPASGSLTSWCWGSACIGSACGGSGCLGSACGASICGGSGCQGSACGGSVCQGSLCGGSVCQSSLCGGSACHSEPCEPGGDFMVAIKSFNYNIEDDQLIVEIATDNHTKLINNGKIYPLNKSMMNRLKIEGKYRKVFFKDISGEKVLCLIDTDEIEHRYILTV